MWSFNKDCRKFDPRETVDVGFSRHDAPGHGNRSDKDTQETFKRCPLDV